MSSSSGSRRAPSWSSCRVANRPANAIWEAWRTGERLAFRGEFYKHTLMTDFFDPGPNPFGNPPILLAAVGERMTAVAGQVFEDAEIIAGLVTRFDTLRNEAFRGSESLALIERMCEEWTASGARAPIRVTTAGNA